MVVNIMLGFGRAGFIPGSHLDSWYDLGQSLQDKTFCKAYVTPWTPESWDSESPLL